MGLRQARWKSSSTDFLAIPTTLTALPTAIIGWLWSECARRFYGLFHEIISWKLRMFVPSDASGVDILAKVLDHYPIARVGEREAA